MPRILAVTTLCLLFLNTSPMFAADRDEYFEYWAKFVGTWQLENQTLELKVTRSESGACFNFDTESITFVHGWDPGEEKMKTLAFYRNGAQGVGHATIENGDMVGQSFTVKPDGTSEDHTWRITRRSDSQFEFSLGNARFVFNRKN